MDRKLLNVFQLKIIAIISMVVDHLAVMLGTGFIYYIPMRTIGRVSFPIFAFLIANGWNKTRDKNAYISRMMIFAAISALPHMLLFGIKKGTDMIDKGIFFTALYVFVFICLMLFFANNTKQNKSVCTIFSVLYFFIPLFTGRRNVLYTFTYAMIVMTFVDKFKAGFKTDISLENGKAPIITAISSIFDKKDVILVPLLFAPALVSGEYGLIGALLIVLLSISQNNAVSMILIVIWAISEYIIRLENITYFIPVLLAALLCLMYSGQKGSDKKYIFYVFYPLHLFILGIIKFFCF